MNNIYELKLHEQVVVSDSLLTTVCLRVPGGWIYSSYDESNQVVSSVFVRYNSCFYSEATKASKEV